MSAGGERLNTVGPRREAPLKVDPATDELISQAAHFLGMSKKDLVGEVVRIYREFPTNGPGCQHKVR